MEWVNYICAIIILGYQKLQNINFKNSVISIFIAQWGKNQIIKLAHADSYELYENDNLQIIITITNIC